MLESSPDLPPVHCPASADAFDLHDASVDLACSPRGRAARHRDLLEKERQVAQWLSDLEQELDAGTIQQLRITGADPERDPMMRQDLDPSTAHILIGSARRGVNRAPAVYVSLVCQRIDSAWHGVSGAYVAICTCPEEANGRAAAERLAASLPSAAAHIPLTQLPPGLRPRPGWWESRLRSAHQLYPDSGSLWTLTRCDQAVAPNNSALLVRTGPRTTSESNLLYVEDPQQLRQFAAMLGDDLNASVAVIRVGPGPVLRRVGGDDGRGVPPVLHDPFTSELSSLIGWAVVTHAGRAELTRSGSRLARQLLHDQGAVGPDVKIWTAPRLSDVGAVDGPGLLRLLAQHTRQETGFGSASREIHRPSL